MKKIFAINSLLFILTGIGINPAATPVIARDLPKITQLDRSDLDNINSTPATQVKLLENGRFPRQKLRLTPIPDTKQTATMTVNTDLVLSVNGQVNPQSDIPKIKMDIEGKITKVAKNGDIYSEFFYTNTEVISKSNTNLEPLEQMRSQLKKIEGFKITIVNDDRGNSKETNFDVPEDLDPAMKSFLESTLNSLKEISSPFPVEPVGIGARWQVTNNLILDGINITQIETYELIDRKGNTITIALNVEQNVDSQEINAPKMPPGVEMEVISYEGKSSGTMKMELNKILPVEYSAEANTNNKIKVTNTNNSQEIITETKLNLRVDLESN